VVKNIKVNRGEKHLLNHVEAQEFRNHSLAKRKHQVVSQSMLSTIFDYRKYDSYSAGLCLEKLLGSRLSNVLDSLTNQPTNQPTPHYIVQGGIYKQNIGKTFITIDLNRSARKALQKSKCCWN
jgi:hypothetical protein